MKYANCPSTNVFHIKVEKELYSATGWRCRQNLKLEIFTPSFTEYVKKCTKVRAARAAQLFFLLQPIISLICCVVVVVAVIVTLTPLCYLRFQEYRILISFLKEKKEKKEKKHAYCTKNYRDKY